MFSTRILETEVFTDPMSPASSNKGHEIVYQRDLLLSLMFITVDSGIIPNLVNMG